MKITNLKLYHVKPRWLFLKIETDVGISGWGEPVVEGRARTVEMAVKEMESYLIGADPLCIEKHWEALYKGTFYRGGPILTSALSGVEQALWDIKGKFYNIPVYEMLGGAIREKVRMYSHCHGYLNDDYEGEDTPERIAANALKKKQLGFNAIKIPINCPVRHIDTLMYVDKQVEKLEAIRSAVGREVDIAIDFHGRTSPAMAMRLANAFEPYYPLFIEEPCLPENVDGMSQIARSTTIPIAAGERLYTRWGFRESLEKQAIAIVQPDLCHAGGIFESKKIAAMAEAYYVSVAPHNPLGPISLASCLQLAACTPNFLIQEHPSLDNNWDLGEGFLREPFEVKSGYIDIPRKPGLGIEINEEVVEQRSFDGSWVTPQVFYEDDRSFSEW